MTESATSGWDVLDRAHTMLSDTVQSVRADQWQVPTPCDQWSATQVLQHAAGDQRAYAQSITGMGGPTADPFSPSGVLDVDPVVMARDALAVTAAAWSGVDESRKTVPTPLPQGELPARVAVGACALDAAVHAWDIAVATGQPSPLSPDLAHELLQVARQIVEPLRAYGVYAGELDAEPGDGDVAALLRYLGRRPDWRSH